MSMTEKAFDIIDLHISGYMQSGRIGISYDDKDFYLQAITEISEKLDSAFELIDFDLYRTQTMIMSFLNSRINTALETSHIDGYITFSEMYEKFKAVDIKPKDD